MHFISFWAFYLRGKDNVIDANLHGWRGHRNNLLRQKSDYEMLLHCRSKLKHVEITEPDLVKSRARNSALAKVKTCSAHAKYIAKVLREVNSGTLQTANFPVISNGLND